MTKHMSAVEYNSLPSISSGRRSLSCNGYGFQRKIQRQIVNTYMQKTYIPHTCERMKTYNEQECCDSHTVMVLKLALLKQIKVDAKVMIYTANVLNNIMFDILRVY